VTAIGADAVPTWPGRLGTPHAARPTTAATSGTATAAAASAKKPLEHRSHLLLQTSSVEQGGASEAQSSKLKAPNFQRLRASLDFELWILDLVDLPHIIRIAFNGQA